MEFDEQSLQDVREGRLIINRYDDWLFEEFRPYLGQRILEIGCGLGNLLGRFIDRRLVIGIETNPEVVETTQNRFREHKNIRVLEQNIVEPDIFDLESLNFDTVISLNVFEHIENDILAIKNAKKLLRPAGYLILIVPSHQVLFGSMDRSIGHYRRYSKRMMREKLQQVEMVHVKQKYINMLGAFGWWLNGRILRKRVPPQGQLQLFNSLVPFLRMLERLTGAPFGLSLLSVAKKGEHSDEI